jgi:hypothetical protein
MDDLLNKTRYNNLIRPATSSSQLISIHLQLSLAQLISVVGAEAAGAPGSGEGAGPVFSVPSTSWKRSGHLVHRAGGQETGLTF